MLLPTGTAFRRLGAGAAFLLSSLLVFGVAADRPQQGGDKPQVAPTAKPPPPAQPAPSKPPPLELDDAEPLRLDAPQKPPSATSLSKGADNTACLVCHANLKKESLAATHASNAVGCTSCHGPSTAHRNDEANVIPPDIMVAAEAIDASCARCHEGHDVEPRIVVKRFLERSPKLTDSKSLVCTTCHGEHHVPVRTVRWDRKTGKLVSTPTPIPKP